MAIKTFTAGSVLTASDTNTYLANSGLVYVTSYTVGSGVASVTVPNAFSSTFDSYRVLYTGGTMSGGTDMSCFLGGTAPANGYYQAQIYVNTTTGASGTSTVNNQPQWTFVGGGSTGGMFIDLTLYNPFNANKKFVTYSGLTADIFYVNGSGRFDSTSSFTSFTLKPAAGGITLTGGVITVYGYRKQ